MGGTFAERRRVAASASELVLAYRCRNSFDGCQHLDSHFGLSATIPRRAPKKKPRFNKIAGYFGGGRFWHCGCTRAIKGNE